MWLLLERKGDEVEITKEVVRATSVNQSSIAGAEIMSLLLKRLGDAASIPDEVLRAIPREWDSGEKIEEYIRCEEALLDKAQEESDV